MFLLYCLLSALIRGPIFIPLLEIILTISKCVCVCVYVCVITPSSISSVHTMSIQPVSGWHHRAEHHIAVLVQQTFRRDSQRVLGAGDRAHVQVLQDHHLHPGRQGHAASIPQIRPTQWERRGQRVPDHPPCSGERLGHVRLQSGDPRVVQRPQDQHPPHRGFGQYIAT